jgi:hypothetical protein
MVKLILKILRKIEALIIRWQNKLLLISTRRDTASTDTETPLNHAENNFKAA